jgi:hypothetical protein
MSGWKKGAGRKGEKSLLQ